MGLLEILRPSISKSVVVVALALVVGPLMMWPCLGFGFSPPLNNTLSDKVFCGLASVVNPPTLLMFTESDFIVFVVAELVYLHVVVSLVLAAKGRFSARSSS